jgi:tetratricopeptide (TPR) repeat protein
VQVTMFQNSRYSHISDLTQLETIEDELWAQNDDHTSEAIKEELIHLYRRMWELQPDEIRYERSIAKLLLELGWDLKRQRVNYEKARKFFEELIQLKKPAKVPIAHYRLGFIHYYNKKWEQAIFHFKQAVGEMLPSRRETDVEPWARLDESQLIKANARLAMAYKNKSIEVAKRTISLYETCSEPDETNRPYMQELKAEILIEEEKPFVCVSSTEVKSMNEREFRQLKEREDVLILDYTDYARKYLYVSGVSRHITGRNLEILRKLLLSVEPIPQWKLEHEIGIRQASVYMNRLREFLRSCGLESEAIVADNGYKWIHPHSYLIYRSDDPDYMF